MKKILLKTALSLLLMNNMTYAAKEIETKISLDSQTLTNFKAWLNTHGKHQGQVKHKECYFNLEPGVDSRQLLFKDAKGLVDTNYTLRIREAEKNGKISYKICLKQCNRNKNDVTTDREELETAITDGSIMQGILETLGYTHHTLLEKTREVFTVTLNGYDFEVVIDDVKQLGQFVEVELKTDVSTVQEGQNAINVLLQTTGIKNYTLYTRNYLHMALNGYNRELFAQEKSI